MSIFALSTKNRGEDRVQLNIGQNDCLRYNWKGRELWLHPARAIYLPAQDACLIADLHLGKANHFRRSGIGVPLGASIDNYERLRILMRDFDPARVYFLGDLFHSFYNASWNRFEQFLQDNSQREFCLIKGNHDILPEQAYTDANLKVCGDELELDGFILRHHPPEKGNEEDLVKPVFCGHIHPGVRLRGKGRQGARIPVFYFSGHSCILPAFGAFTGLAIMQAGKSEAVFGLVGKSVIALSRGSKP